MSHQKSKNDKYWLTAFKDEFANAQSFSSCVRYADVEGNGDNSLVIATMDKKLKTFSGVKLIKEHQLLGVPVSLNALYLDESERGKKVQMCVAVATGAYVFVYKRMRPFLKFMVPDVKVHDKEKAIWDKIRDAPRITSAMPSETFDALSKLRDSNVNLSSRSVSFLCLEHEEELMTFMQKNKNEEIQEKAVITCMETLALNKDDEYSVRRLVVGTEDGRILIVNPLKLSISKVFEINGTPLQIAPLGIMNVDYRIFVLTREGQILTIKNGEISGRVLPCDGVPVGMVCAGAKEIYIALSNRVFEVRTMKGRKVCSVYLESNILDMQLFEKDSTSRAVILGLANGEIRIYKLNRLLYKSNIEEEGVAQDTIMALRCGRYGRSNICLATVRRSGTLRVKIFRRQAKLDLTSTKAANMSTHEEGSNSEDAVPPLKLPKKTQVYVEQVQHEREHAQDMHHTFQRDLASLRMKSAQSYVNLIKVHGPSFVPSRSTSTEISVRLNAEIRGLGPQFHLLVHVISNNTTTKDTTLRNLLLTFSFDHNLYHMPRNSIRIPVLIPGITYKYKFVVRSVDQNGAAGNIGIHLYPQDMSLPSISADVTMPLSEVFLEDED